MRTYSERWQLAVALKQPYPRRFDTGDVMPAEPAPDASQLPTPSQWKQNLEAFAQTVGSVRNLVIGTAVGGLVIGGLIGYGIAKKR